MTTPKLVTALVGVALLAAACGSSSTSASTSSSSASQSVSTATTSKSVTPSTSATTTSKPVTPSACTDLGGTVGQDRVCTVHSQTADYTIDMKFPADYPDQAAVTKVLTKQRDAFVKAAGGPHMPDATLAFDVKTSAYQSGTPTTGTQSLVFEVYTNLGGAHPETEYEAVNYDLGTKAPITFDTLFKPGSDPVAVLDPIVKDFFVKLLQGGPVEDNAIGPQMYQAFALTDDDVIFFIGQGMWAMEAAGAQHVSIPRAQLASILAS